MTFFVWRAWTFFKARILLKRWKWINITTKKISLFNYYIPRKKEKNLLQLLPKFYLEKSIIIMPLVASDDTSTIIFSSANSNNKSLLQWEKNSMALSLLYHQYFKPLCFALCHVNLINICVSNHPVISHHFKKQIIFLFFITNY